VKKIRLVIVLFAVAFAAWMAPQAFAGVGTSTITVIPQGSGAGSVISSPAVSNGQINCGYSTPVIFGPKCTLNVVAADVPVTITLTAFTGGNSAFTSWGPGCPLPSGNTCTITILVAGTDFVVRPNFAFASPTRTLTVTKTGNGSGTVTGPGINCGTNCTATYPVGTVVRLVATPAAGSTFGGWGGGCAGSGRNLVCILSMAVNQGVTANFTLAPSVPLTVTLAGNGSGSVAGGGIACPSTCTLNFNQGQVVNLNATPNAGSAFGGWSGSGCSGTAACIVTIGSSAASVTATFNLTAVQASLVGWHTSRTSNGRQTRATISAQQVVNFTIRIVRGSRVIVSREILNFQPGQRNVILRIPNGTNAGPATIQVTFINTFQATKSQSGNVKIPSL
jgi:hypothetical protein